MRLISQSDISKLYQEKIENIIKDFCDLYSDKTIINNNITNKGNYNVISVNMNGIINQNSNSDNGNANINKGINREQISNNHISGREIINTNSLELEGKIH
jgi:hypothetical protein